VCASDAKRGTAAVVDCARVASQTNRFGRCWELDSPGWVPTVCSTASPLAAKADPLAAKDVTL